MTYWQRLCLEYPDMQECGVKSRAVKCPASWGYEQRIKGECLKMKNCEAYWNREIPERKRA